MKTNNINLEKDLRFIHKNRTRVITDGRGDAYVKGISKEMIITNPGLFVDELPIIIEGLGIKYTDKSYQSAVKIIEATFDNIHDLTMVGTAIESIKSTLVFVTPTRRILLRVNRVTGQWERDTNASLNNCSRR